MQYRRNREAGGTYFFTLVTYQRQHLLTIPENVKRLRTAFKREMQKRPFEIEAIVILPDHLHTIWVLPKPMMIIRQGGVILNAISVSLVLA
jgi:putative transposase